MSANGAGWSTPSRSSRTFPACSTTRTRLVSPGGAVTYVGLENVPIWTSETAPRAHAGAASTATIAHDTRIRRTRLSVADGTIPRVAGPSVRHREHDAARRAGGVRRADRGRGPALAGAPARHVVGARAARLDRGRDRR